MVNQKITVDKAEYEEVCRRARGGRRPPEYRINESADKIRLDTKVKRGSDVRNEDVVKVQVKGDNPEDAASELRRVLNALESEGITDTLRQTQPGESDE